MATVFVSDGPAALTAPGFGPLDDVVVGTIEPPGRLTSFDRESGATVIPPFEAFATPHAPRALSGRIATVTLAGRVVLYEPTGAEVARSPQDIGSTVGLELAPGPSLRLAGFERLLGVDASGDLLFDATGVSGAVVGGVAVAPDGVTFVATDVGQLLGVDTSGAVVLETTLPLPVLTAPVVLDGRAVAVGAAGAVHGFEPSGAPRFRTELGFTPAGLVPTSSGVLAYSSDGRMTMLDGGGRARASVTVPGGLDQAPILLPGDQLGVISTDGVGRTLSPEGAILAEDPVPAPTGPLLASPGGTDGRAYFTSGARLVSVDFLFEQR